MTTEILNVRAEASSLPFRLGIVRTEEQLSAICQVRCNAYSRHVPEFGVTLAKPEDTDTAPGALTLFIQDKLTQKIIGTARLQTNLEGPLGINSDVALPAWLLRAPSAEITRFAVLPSYSNAERLISKILIKACYHYCFATQIHWMVIGSRRSLVKWYHSLGFKAVDGFEDFFELLHTGNLRHKLLILDVIGAERQWLASKNVDYDFVFRTYHPDIELFSSLSGVWTRPRLSNRAKVSSDQLFPIV